MKPFASVICAAACLVFAAGAAAKKTPGYLTPPGNSGITQYSEVVPSSNGNTPTGGLKPTNRVPPTAAHALSHSGTAGKGLESFVAATAPRGAGSSSHRHRSGTSSPAPANAGFTGSPGGASGLASIARSLVGHGGGMGFILPLILAAALGAALALRFRRRASS